MGFLFAGSCLWAQTQAPSQDMSGMSMPGTNMSGHDIAGVSDDGAAHAMQSMEGEHMDMGPHMKMTTLRGLKPGDQEKADQVARSARQAAERYKDYKTALAEGFEIFHPNLPQKQYHFTNYRYALEARVHFNPDHPTSLLYEKHGSDYTLIGVMYTAPKNFTEDELDARIPLSIAQWHAHVNLCLPPADRKAEAFGPDSKFGLHGSIATQEACEAAGGKFLPQIFGWMVHVYPFADKSADVWSVERQAVGQNHMD
jgi:hypothetical protein